MLRYALILVPGLAALPAFGQPPGDLLNPAGGSLLNPGGGSLLRTAPPPASTASTAAPGTTASPVDDSGGIGAGSAGVYVGPDGAPYGVAIDADGRQVLVPLAGTSLSGGVGSAAASGPPVPFHVTNTGGVLVGSGQGAIVITDVMRPGTIKGVIVPGGSGGP